MSVPSRGVERGPQDDVAPVTTAGPAEIGAPAAPVPLPVLAVGAAGDTAEADADRAADAALSRLTPLDDAHQHDLGGAHRVSRLPSAGAAGAVVGAAGGRLDPATSAAIESRRGGGTSLPAGVRSRMEGAFGGSFASVRVHDDAAAAGLSRSVSARAFTVGSDIFFDRGQFAPDTAAGERVLAHELAHTRQPDARARRLIRRVINPEDAHELADVMDQIFAKPKKARALATTHLVRLKALAADGGFTARLDVDMRALLQDLSDADVNPATDLTQLVKTYKTAHDTPTWTHVAGASFTPKRQDAAAAGGNAGTGPLFEDEDAEAEFKLGTGAGLSDLDALVRFATVEIDKANAKHEAEMAGLTALERAATVMVFLGPEWMFSERGTPVLPDVRQSIIDKFRKLSLLYPQMVIVPGTIRSGKPRESNAAQWKDIRNTVFVVWNGRLVHTHDKAGNAGDTNIDGSGAGPIKRYGGKSTKEMTKDPIFELGNLKFAIDICADHSSDRAKRAIGTDPKADVHLVTGWGQVPETAHSATDAGQGVMLGSDAEGAGPNLMGRGARSPMPGNRTRPTMPGRAGAGVVGALVPEPVHAAGDQILTGHAVGNDLRSGKAVLTYYGRQQP